MARIAALQFASGTDVDRNLATCLRMIDRARVRAPDLLVLPEFSNHISWYEDAEHAWRVSLDRSGPFLKAIAERARRHGCYIVINVSLRGDDGKLTVSSLMYDPRGQLLAVADKQTLMGHENTWFARAQSTSDVVETPFGRLAMFPCRDGVTCETPRGLALRGAQLFCDSLNSFALDEATLHVPARAPENKVFLVAANKIGPLIPEHLLAAVSAETHIPLRFLSGAGESQIVSPEGEVLVRGPRDEEAVVFAEVDLSLADNKGRPDGTHLFAGRRPELYLPIAEPPSAPVCEAAAQRVTVACLVPRARDEAALGELSGLVAGLPGETVLAVLPELFCYNQPVELDLPAAAALAERAIDAMQSACAGRAELVLCASLPVPVGKDLSLTTLLVNAAGVCASQRQLHSCARHAWSVGGDELVLAEMPWGRLALMAGDDAVYPELVKIAALRGAHVMAVPFAMQESWEEAYGLRSRAAENRICVVASTRPLAGRAGLIASLERDFTLMTPWHEREFDGFINAPLVTEQAPDAVVTVADIHPAAACNKLMSERTDLLLDRPWNLSQDLLRPWRENPKRACMTDTRKLLKDHLLGAAHVGFVVQSLDKAVANASRVYGLGPGDVSYQPEPGEDALTRFAFFRVGDLEFELIEPCSEHFRQLLLAMPSGGAGINHVAWRVDDIEAAVALLADNDIRPGHVTPDGIVAIGAKKMVYLDPATTGGLVIELIQYPAEDIDGGP